MAEGRELILKLGQKITDRIGVKVTTSDPEYWGLACVITVSYTHLLYGEVFALAYMGIIILRSPIWTGRENIS